MAAKSIVAYNAISRATLSMSNEDADYPATNGNDHDPANPLMATGGSTVITMSGLGSFPITFFEIVNHNLTSATLANSAGLSQAITIPPRTSAGYCVNAAIDLRLIANTTAATWTLTATSAGTLGIGELAGGPAAELNWRLDGSIVIEEDYPHDSITTFYQAKTKYKKGVRIRRARGLVNRESDRAVLEAIDRFSEGGLYPFLLWPDTNVNDALYGYRVEPYSWSPRGPNETGMPISFEEASMSLPL